MITIEIFLEVYSIVFVILMFLTVTQIIWALLFPALIQAKLSFIWYDLWVGLYFDNKKKITYIVPFPMIVFSFRFVK